MRWPGHLPTRDGAPRGERRLVLHVGMPKTGTTSIQNWLARSGVELADMGVDYPKRLLAPGTTAHHMLAPELLARADTSGPRVAELLQRVADDRGARCILVSSELLATCVIGEPGVVFLELLAKCRRHRAVEVVLALRRMDTFLESMYLQQVKLGLTAEPPDAFFRERIQWVGLLFQSLSRLQGRRDLADLHVVPFSKEASFTKALLNACGVDPTRLGPQPSRANVRLGLKAMTALRFLPELEAELGLRRALWRPGLVDALERGDFTFSGETHHYSVATPELRRELHEEAARMARSHGVSAYAEAVSNESEGRQPHVTMTRSLLSANDWARFKEFLTAIKRSNRREEWRLRFVHLRGLLRRSFGV